MIKYKDTYAKKGSELFKALTEGGDPAKVYKETTERFNAMYSPEDRAWFYTKHKESK